MKVAVVNLAKFLGGDIPSPVAAGDTIYYLNGQIVSVRCTSPSATTSLGGKRAIARWVTTCISASEVPLPGGPGDPAGVDVNFVG